MLGMISSTGPHGSNMRSISSCTRSPSTERPFPMSIHHLMPMERALRSSISPLPPPPYMPPPLPPPLPPGRADEGERSGTLPPW